MGFCSKDQYESFLSICPGVEKIIVGNGIQLIKLWLEVGQEEQERRMNARIHDPLRQWKLSPMDVESWPRWYEYSLARDSMFEATDTKEAPWYVLRSDDKRRARLNCITHILGLIPYKYVPPGTVKLPKRSKKHRYDDQATLKGRRFVAEKYCAPGEGFGSCGRERQVSRPLGLLAPDLVHDHVDGRRPPFADLHSAAPS
jgi:hypothetical protein